MGQKRVWKKIDSKEVYSNRPFFWVTEDTVERPDGKTTQYGVTHGPGAVFIVAITTDGRYVFVEQERYPVGRSTVELAAGGLGDNHPDPVVQARHELEEEIGTGAEKYELIGELLTAPSRQHVIMKIVLATGVDAGKVSLDGQEGNEAINDIPILGGEEVLAKIKSGEINDAVTVAALGLYWAKYGHPDQSD